MCLSSDLEAECMLISARNLPCCCCAAQVKQTLSLTILTIGNLQDRKKKRAADASGVASSISAKVRVFQSCWSDVTSRSLHRHCEQQACWFTNNMTVQARQNFCKCQSSMQVQKPGALAQSLRAKGVDLKVCAYITVPLQLSTC
jgi:hypothetical protein